MSRMNRSHKIDLPKPVAYAIEQLEANGEEAYLVGGAVRDHFLARPIHDYDITTSSLPERTQEIFAGHKTYDIGSAYGTIVLVLNGMNIEITTYRSESDYDGRRPRQVQLGVSLEEDLKRRDFTINAMAYSPKRGLVDQHGGLEDLEKGLIRAIGQADLRLKEDYLRILRAVRFASQLDFDIDPGLGQALKTNSHRLKEISGERIRDEFNKLILTEPPSRAIGLLRDYGILEILSQDLAAMVGYDQQSSFHQLDLYDHTMKTLDGTQPILELRLAALFHDVGKPRAFFMDEEGEARYYGHQNISAEIARDFMTRHSYPKKTIQSVCRLVERHMDNVNTYTPKSIRKLVGRMEGDLDLLFDLQEADVRASKEVTNLANVDRGRWLAKEIEEKNLATDKADLAINGHDLIAIGFEEGKVLGDFLDYLFDLVLEDESLNTYDKLRDIASEYLGGKN